MAARTWTPPSRSRSSSGSSSSSDTTMMDMPPQSPSRPARLRNSSQSQPSTVSTAHPAVHDLSFSLLLSLPRELRDRIYTAALTAPYLFSWPGKPPARASHHVNVGLLRANRQVYDEAVAILYSHNKLLFTHPSDLNIFRVIAAPASQNITSVYFRIREKDLRLWTSYLSSKNPERSLKADLPNLRNLWLFMRCGSMGAPAMLGQLGNGGGAQGGGPHVQQPHHGLHLHALQNTLLQTQHHQAAPMQQQTHGLPFAAQAPPVVAVAPQTTHNNHTPPPPPPAPVPFIQFTQGVLSYGGHANPNGHTNQQHNNNNNTHLFAQHTPSAPPHPTAATIPPPTPVLPGQPTNTHPLYTSFLRPTTHPLYTSFLRFEREMGIEWLCLSLQDTLTCTSASASATNDATTSTSTSANTKPEVKIVCIMRIPRPEVDRLASLYPDELSVDRHGDARTRFWKVRGVELSLEFSGFDVPGEEREREREDGEGEGEGEG